MKKKNASFNIKAYNKALAVHHIGDADVAEMMEISEVTLWRKKTGLTDFYAGEMMSFKTKAQLTEQEAKEIFFGGHASE